ncbi:MAG: peptide chain release factor N(5)-glutamine methyltransferase [Acidobacteriota bacterium]|nr:peptide chain release factor N(5)-glutamine methyltransferase [Acidobacteriota bacterium]
MTIKDRLDHASEEIRRAGSEATLWDARILLAHVLGHTNPLGLDPSLPVPESPAERFEKLWARRLSGTPVQHLVGEWDFFGRPFRVDVRGLIPRPETEVLILQALGAAAGARSVLDLGTGSGIIAVTLLLELPMAHAVALDASLDALALARENGIRHGVLSRLRLAASDWLSALAGTTFDLVVSNPPYLARTEAASLPRTVAAHDPALALYGGDDGLDAIRALLDCVPAFLAAGSPFLFEIGFGQAIEVMREISARPAWRLEGISRDLAAIPRVVRLRRV